MKKTLRSLLLFALLFTVAGAFAVSCQKGGEEDVPEVGAGSRPYIIPSAQLKTNMYTITADGTTISATSVGYSFTILAKELTFKFFTCYLVNKEEMFSFINDCNLTLQGGSTIILANRGFFGGNHITLSGSGSITFKKMGSINETDYNNMFSAAEGYTLTSTGEVDEGDNWYSCTWTVDKSK